MTKQSKSHGSKPHRTNSSVWILTLLVLTILACSLGRSKEPPKIVQVGNLLPTLTPTPRSGLTALAPADQTSINVSPADQVPHNPVRSGMHLPTLTPTPTAKPVEVAAATSLSAPVNSPSSPATNPSLNSAPGPNPAPVSPVKPGDVPSSSVTNPSPNSPTNPNPAPVSRATPRPTATSTQPSPTPTPTATVPGPIDPNLPAPAPVPDDAEPDPNLPEEIAGWSFVGVRTSIEEGDVFLVGELVNNTGGPQTRINISGEFYDRQNEIIEDEIDTVDYVPIEIVPAGAHIPFELIVESDQPVFRVDLTASSSPGSNAPRQDFQFSDVSQWIDESGLYCLKGQVRNLGSPLAEYLIVLATVFDDKGHVVSFGEHAAANPAAVGAEQPSSFEMCIDPLEQQITRHTLKALGI